MTASNNETVGKKSDEDDLQKILLEHLNRCRQLIIDVRNAQGDSYRRGLKHVALRDARRNFGTFLDEMEMRYADNPAVAGRLDAFRHQLIHLDDGIETVLNPSHASPTPMRRPLRTTTQCSLLYRFFSFFTKAPENPVNEQSIQLLPTDTDNRPPRNYGSTY